jgi:transcription initiation factor TFIIIB Brf1 subunit/transcription initiation factor TFIIB
VWWAVKIAGEVYSLYNFLLRALNTKLIRITLKLPISVVPPFFSELLFNETSNSLVR